jgi:hypothetical protein
MSTISNIKNWLNKPYPGPESYASEVKGMLWAGIIVFLVLYVFRPFGMGMAEGSILLMSLGFGAVTIVIGSVYSAFTLLVLKLHKDIESWQIKHWIVDTFFMIGLIGAGNFLFLLIRFDGIFTFEGLGIMLFYTLLVAIIPLVIFGFKNQLKLERKHNQDADSISEKEVNSTSEDEIIAVEAMQNYIHIYATENGILVKRTERSTLSSFLNDCDQENVIKCHRSYLVNCTAVKKITGNAQGLKLEMAAVECPLIPVSRSYISQIKLALNQLNESN